MGWNTLIKWDETLELNEDATRIKLDATLVLNGIEYLN